MTLPNQKTFLTFQSEIARETLGLDAATASTRPNLTELKRIINAAYQKVCASNDWGWMYREGTFTTVIGQTTPYYPTPPTGAGIAQIEWMTIPAFKVRLLPIDARAYVNAYPGGYTGYSNMRPQFYVESYANSSAEQGYLLGPGPADDTYTIGYGYKLDPAEMSADGDYPVVPAPYQDLIKFTALIDIYRTFGPGSKERLEEARKEFQILWDKAWLDDARNGEMVRVKRDASAIGAAVGSLNAHLWNSHG